MKYFFKAAPAQAQPSRFYFCCCVVVLLCCVVSPVSAKLLLLYYFAVLFSPALSCSFPAQPFQNGLSGLVYLPMFKCGLSLLKTSLASKTLAVDNCRRRASPTNREVQSVENPLCIQTTAILQYLPGL